MLEKTLNYDNTIKNYEDRTEMLRLIVDLVAATVYADNPEWSVDEQVAKDIRLIDSIAERQYIKN